MAIALNRVVVTPQGRRDGVFGWHGQALVKIIHQRLLIHGVVYGAAHPHIAEGLLVHIHRQVAGIHARLRQELEVGVGANRLNVLGLRLSKP